MYAERVLNTIDVADVDGDDDDRDEARLADYVASRR
jgi:hypothetical protein